MIRAHHTSDDENLCHWGLKMLRPCMRMHRKANNVRADLQIRPMDDDDGWGPCSIYC